jgi:hypothetical protein
MFVGNVSRTFARLAATLGIASLLFCTAVFSQQSRSFKAELGFGQSVRVPETNITITFNELVEDSRCPDGTDCIQAGDAAVRIVFARPNEPPVSHVLHTNSELLHEVELGEVKVQLVAVMPRGASSRPGAYRVTLLIDRK